MISPARKLRNLIARDLPALAPLVLDPLSAKMAEKAGFEALYLGGGTLGYVKTTTEANLSLTQMVQTGVEIRTACTLPLILDGQCGWGDPMHVRNTISASEAAGFAAIELEDQFMPKRAHHHVGVEHLVPMQLMADKIKVAARSRKNPDFIIIARTNACRSDTLDEALRRAEAYRNAGADMLLILPKNPEQARAIGERIEGPLLHLMLGSVSTGKMTRQELGVLGYKLIVDGLTPFYARQKALRLCYEAIARGDIDPTVGSAFKEEDQHVHEAIGLTELLEIERDGVEKWSG